MYRTRGPGRWKKRYRAKDTDISERSSHTLVFSLLLFKKYTLPSDDGENKFGCVKNTVVFFFVKIHRRMPPKGLSLAGWAKERTTRNATPRKNDKGRQTIHAPTQRIKKKRSVNKKNAEFRVRKQQKER